MKITQNNNSAALSDPALPSANIAMTQTAGFTETAAHQLAHSNEKHEIADEHPSADGEFAEAPHNEEHSDAENVGPKAEPSKGTTPTTEVPINQIRDDEGTQTRVSIDEAIVTEYSERMKEGDSFPPIDLFQEDDHYWVGDGFHRLFARKKMGCKKIDANVRPGGRIEALKHSLSANSKHGLQRTTADKRKAIHIALTELNETSSREISRLCGVGRQLVEEVRRQLDESTSSKSRVGKDGKKRRMPQKKAAAKSKDSKKGAKPGGTDRSANGNSSPNGTAPKTSPDRPRAETNPDAPRSQPAPSQSRDTGPALFTFNDGTELRSDWSQGWISGAQIATKLKGVANCAQHAVRHRLTDEELLERQKAIESCGRWANQLGGVEPGKKRLDDIREAFSVIGNLIAETLHKLNLPPPTPPRDEEEYSGPDIC